MINKSFEALTDVILGMWTDYDLGCFFDDYLGCVPSMNQSYVYNSGEYDGEPETCLCLESLPTYCQDIPMVGTKFLHMSVGGEKIEQSMGHFMPLQSLATIPPQNISFPLFIL